MTECFLQAKLLKTTGKLLRNLEKNAVRLIESSTLATAEQCVVTADGMLLKVAGGPGSVAAKVEGRAAAQAVRAEAHAVATIPWQPLGLGSTGRAEPASLHEQMVLKGVLSDPNIGTPITDVIMTDPRWHQKDGWQKMYYHNDDHGIEIHYVVQKKDGIITAIDDFKFKNIPRLIFFDYQGKK